MKYVIKLLKILLYRFNLAVYKIPYKISIGIIKKKANEDLATSMYIKQLISIHAFQKKFNEVNNLINILVPFNENYLHLDWINNESQGRGSLDSYRIVKKYDAKILLKYYFTGCVELSKTIYFHEKISPLTREFISTSKLVTTRKSELLSEIGFQFIDSKRQINNEDKQKMLITIISVFHKNFKMDNIKNKLTNIPQFLLDYKTHFEYCRSKAEIIQTNSIPEIETIFQICESQIESEELVLSHGDLHPGNIISGHLIDWDNFGFFPLGFDAAFTFWKMDLNLDNKKNVLEFLDANILEYIPTCEKEKFKRNFIFFVVVFTRVKHSWMSSYLLKAKIETANYTR